MRALITGASGCLGRALVDELSGHGWQLRTTARMPADLPDFHPADLVSDDLLPLTEGMDAVFHCAALSGGWGSPMEFVAVNVTATHLSIRGQDQRLCVTLGLCIRRQSARREFGVLTEVQPISPIRIDAWR